jgi:hypothetical protein
MPQVQNAELLSWLKGLYPIWAGLTPEMLLSGCTTSDHLYHYHGPARQCGCGGDSFYGDLVVLTLT